MNITKLGSLDGAYEINEISFSYNDHNVLVKMTCCSRILFKTFHEMMRQSDLSCSSRKIFWNLPNFLLSTLALYQNSSQTDNLENCDFYCYNIVVYEFLIGPLAIYAWVSSKSIFSDSFSRSV